MRRRSGLTRGCWPAICWRSTAERKRGRGSRLRTLPALRRRRTMTTTTMRGWRSTWPLDPRSGPVPCRLSEAPLAAQSLQRRGQQRPCPGHGRQPSLHLSLPRQKRKRSLRGRLPPSQGSRRGACGRVGRVLSTATRYGGYGAGTQHSPSRSHPGACSGLSQRSTTGPCVEGCRRGDHCSAYVGGGAAGARNLKAEAFCNACLRVCSQSTRTVFVYRFFSDCHFCP
jgi:hypothetical protein